jgi:hypothetical protein
MEYEPSIRRYRFWYAKLLRLYSKPFRERFGEGIEQTFNDLLRERAEEDSGLFGCALGMFVETSAGILRENLANIIAQNKRLIGIIFAAALILLVPLVAMQFTEEVNWDLFDFAFMGALLLGTGLAYDLAARRAGTMAYRAAVGVALAAAFLLVWINGAVGLIGSEDNPANLLYGGVLAVGVFGASIARFRSHGMARALFAAALAQALVPVIALIVWKPSVASAEEFLGMLSVFGVNSFFVVLFVASAMLFRRAARQPT